MAQIQKILGSSRTRQDQMFPPKSIPEKISIPSLNQLILGIIAFLVPFWASLA